METLIIKFLNRVDGLFRILQNIGFWFWDKIPLDLQRPMLAFLIFCNGVDDKFSFKWFFIIMMNGMAVVYAGFRGLFYVLFLDPLDASFYVALVVPAITGIIFGLVFINKLKNKLLWFLEERQRKNDWQWNGQSRKK